MQRMTDFCQIVPMSRLFETLERRVFQYPTLRNLTEKGGCSLWSRPQVPCMGFLRDTSVHWTFLTTSRHSPDKFGSALDFRNIIESLPFSRQFIEVFYINEYVSTPAISFVAGVGHLLWWPKRQETLLYY